MDYIQANDKETHRSFSTASKDSKSNIAFDNHDKSSVLQMYFF